MAQYLVKYLDSTGKTTIVDSATDTFQFPAIILDGAYFDKTNIAQVSGLSGLDAEIAGVSAIFDGHVVQNDAAFADIALTMSGFDDSLSNLAGDVNFIMGDDPKEEFFVAVSGQVLCSVTGFDFSPDNGIPDIQIFKNGLKMRISPSGILESGTDVKKNSDVQIEFFIPLVANDRVTIRRERGALLSNPKAYFRDDTDGLMGKAVLLSDRYLLGNNSLIAFRNGVLIHKTSSLGVPADRYEETTDSFITVGANLVSTDVVTSVHKNVASTSRFYQEGASAFSITVPSYTTGSDRLMVFRNGLLLNSDGLGTSIQQYTETSSTQVTFGVLVEPDDLTAFENLSSVQWREDQIVASGTVVNFSNPYTLGNERLLVFRDGVLMFNSGVLGDPIDRYSETSTTSITLASAASGEVFSAIYL